MNRIWKNRFSILLGACALALASQARADGSSIWQNATASYSTYEYIDFLATGGAGHDAQWSTYNFAGTPLKYFPYQLGTNTNENLCYEISTTAPTFYPAATGDTRIWVYDRNTLVYKSLDDDGGPGAFSLGRVFLRGPNASVSVYTAAYSVNHHSIHFGLRFNRLNLTEAQCTTGQATVPWVKNIGGTMTWSANAN